MLFEAKDGGISSAGRRLDNGKVAMRRMRRKKKIIALVKGLLDFCSYLLGAQRKPKE